MTEHEQGKLINEVPPRKELARIPESIPMIFVISEDQKLKNLDEEITNQYDLITNDAYNKLLENWGEHNLNDPRIIVGNRGDVHLEKGSVIINPDGTIEEVK